MSSELSNKVVVITGASSGLGAACARKFAAATAKLALIGRNEHNLQTVAIECEQIGGLRPLTITADITIDSDVEKIVNETIRHYGRIDVLVNNAGIYLYAGVQDGISIFDKIMATNLRGTYLLTSLAVPYLIKSSGNIVNISSVLSTKAKSILVPYCMSKAAIDMFTRATALELGPKGVRVNSVNPGPVNTELFKRGGMDDDANEKMFEHFQKTLPLQRVTQSKDIAEMVFFLSSDKANSVTGGCFAVDCGLSAGEVEDIVKIP